jgi:hypothetical protein
MALTVFKRLRHDEPISIHRFWDSEYQVYEREWKQAHSDAELERIFQKLVRLSYVKELQPGYYRKIELKATPDTVMRTLLRGLQQETKANARDFRRLDLFAVGLFLSALGLMAVVFFASFQGFVLGTGYSQIALAVFILLLFSAIVVNNRSSRFWDRHGLSNEKRVATKLVDAYDLYVNPNRDETDSAAEIVKKVSQTLQRAEQTTRWDTVIQDSRALSRIGQDLSARVVPAMADKRRDKAKTGEILIRLACLFFESTRQALGRAPHVYESLPVGPSVQTVLRARLLGLADRRLGQLLLSAAGGLAAILAFLLIWSLLLDVTILDLARENIGYLLTAFAALFVGILMWLPRQVSRYA